MASYSVVAMQGKPFSEMTEKQKERWVKARFFEDLVDLNPEAADQWKEIESEAKKIARADGDPKAWGDEVGEVAQELFGIDVSDKGGFGAYFLDKTQGEGLSVPKIRQENDPFVKSYVRGGFFEKALSEATKTIVPAVVQAATFQAAGSILQGVSDSSIPGVPGLDFFPGSFADNVPEGRQPAEKSDDDLQTVLDNLDIILRDATPPGEGPQILDDEVSVFDPPQQPAIEDVAQDETNDPTPDDSGIPDIPLVVPPSEGVLSDPTQPPTDPETGEEETDDQRRLAGLFLLGLAGNNIFGARNEVDTENKRPNIPHQTVDGQPVFSDFNTPIHLPRLSLERFRNRRLALPDFMV